MAISAEFPLEAIAPLTLQALTQSQTGHAKWKRLSCVK